MTRLRRDDGSVTLLTVVLAFGLLLVAGLVLDGSSKLTGQARADNQAEQAARAGAQAVDLSALRASGNVSLRTAAARDAALSYLTAAGYPDGQVTVTGRDIERLAHHPAADESPGPDRLRRVHPRRHRPRPPARRRHGGHPMSIRSLPRQPATATPSTGNTAGTRHAAADDRPQRWRAAGAASALSLAVVGVPLLLLAASGPPWPAQLPTLTSVGDALTRPDDGTLALAIIRLVAWAAWASFTLSVGVEALAQLDRPPRHRPARAGSRLSLPRAAADRTRRHDLLLTDLEATGSVNLPGADDDELTALRGVAVEVAVSAGADNADVVLVGFGAELVALEPDRLSYHDELDDPLLRRLEAHAKAAGEPGDGVLATRFRAASEPCHPIPCPAGQRADARGRRAARRRRTRPPPDRHRCRDRRPGPTPRDDRLQQGASRLHRNHRDRPLRDSGAGGRGSANETAHGARRGSTQEQRTRRRAPDGACGRQRRPTGGGRRASRGGSGRRSAGHRAAARRPDQLDQDLAAWHDDSIPGYVRVGILGPVEVRTGHPAPSDRGPLLTELVTYLALHPRGVSPDSLDVALWPTRAVKPSTRHEALARARRWLGDNTDGAPLLPTSHTGSITLGGVLADWDLFQRLVARGRAGDGATLARDFEQAQRLVRGAPFADTPARRYAWVAETYLEHNIPPAVLATVQLLSEHQLATRDLAAARDTARRGLSLDRYAEPSWQALIAAEKAEGTSVVPNNWPGNSPT